MRLTPTEARACVNIFKLTSQRSLEAARSASYEEYAWVKAAYAEGVNSLALQALKKVANLPEAYKGYVSREYDIIEEYCTLFKLIHDTRPDYEFAKAEVELIVDECVGAMDLHGILPRTLGAVVSN